MWKTVKCNLTHQNGNKKQRYAEENDIMLISKHLFSFVSCNWVRAGEPKMMYSTCQTCDVRGKGMRCDGFRAGDVMCGEWWYSENRSLFFRTSVRFRCSSGTENLKIKKCCFNNSRIQSIVVQNLLRCLNWWQFAHFSASSTNSRSFEGKHHPVIHRTFALHVFTYDHAGCYDRRRIAFKCFRPRCLSDTWARVRRA